MVPLAALLAGLLLAAPVPPPTPRDPLKDVEIVDRSDALLPLDASLRDEEGRQVPMGAFFQPGRPVLVALVYYNCPMLCTLVLNGVVDAVKEVGLDAGRDFEVVALSIAPEETPELARAKKASYLQALGDPAASPRWHFLTGPQDSIAQVAEAVGFRYRWDEATKQYAHAAGIFVATPDGRLSRTFYGVKYAPRDLRLALVDASRGKVGTSMDRVLLACYDWDRSSGRYGLAAMRLVRLGSGLTVLLLGGLLVALWRRDVRRGAQHRTA
jgi:protein SCO1/2